MPTEATYVGLLCGFLGGAQPETAHQFDVYGFDRPRHVEVDCETPTHVIEIGRDVLGSRDSLHQAAFAAVLTGKTPLVIIIDEDGSEGRFEQEIRRAADYLGIGHVRCSGAFLGRWAATAGSSGLRIASFNDLPHDPTVALFYPLGDILEAAGL